MEMPDNSQEEINLRALVYAWAKKYSVEIDEHDVDDLTQVVATTVIAKFQSLTVSGAAVMFARRVAQRRVIDLLRARRRGGSSELEDQASIVDESSSSASQAVEIQDAFYWCLEKLRKRWQEVIRMHMRGTAHMRISEELNITIDSVKQDAMQARKSLRRCLEAQHALG